MIIQQRSSGISYGTDPIAASLRALIAAPGPRGARHEAAEPVPATVADLADLYPSIYGRQARRPIVSRAMRAFTFRASVLGSLAAAMVAFIHH